MMFNDGRPTTEQELVALALALGARDVRGWSKAETALAATAAATPAARVVSAARAAVRAGADPLGDAFCALRTPAARRPAGATYTPTEIVRVMTAWAAGQGDIERVVDPGAGSGRFSVAAGRALRGTALVAVETDPLAATLARAHIAAAGLGERAEVVTDDFRALRLSHVAGRTMFLGNPPYVRHHLLGSAWKSWLTETARRHGLAASQLAGLHVHFFLATLEHARPGDLGAFVTAAEWLDVNYGQLVRDLLMGSLGARSIHLIDARALPFADAATTGVITCFEIGARPSSVYLRQVSGLADLATLSSGHPVRRERLETARRWTPLVRPRVVRREGFIELGELCRVHRGAVTGANRVWIADERAADLPPAVLYPTVTKARELFAAGNELADASRLRRVIDLPADLDVFDAAERRAIDRFLKLAKTAGADRGFVAQHRRAWWSVGLRDAAPILATYMARRPPAFVRNRVGARHINIAHGLYPRETLSDRVLRRLAEYLARQTSLNDGRTYSGGLTKFEPKEMERLLVPGIDVLRKETWPDGVLEEIETSGPGASAAVDGKSARNGARQGHFDFSGGSDARAARSVP